MTRHGGRACKGHGRREEAFVPRSPGRARGGGSSTAAAMRTGAAVERVRNSGAAALRRSWVLGGGGWAGETMPTCNMA